MKIQPAAYNLDDPLKKRKFCAQDIFDVETKITGFGSPEWEKTHEKATKTAAVLEILKQGGATCIGKTVMDELGFKYGWYKLYALCIVRSVYREPTP